MAGVVQLAEHSNDDDIRSGRMETYYRNLLRMLSSGRPRRPQEYFIGVDDQSPASAIHKAIAAIAAVSARSSAPFSQPTASTSTASATRGRAVM